MSGYLLLTFLIRSLLIFLLLLLLSLLLIRILIRILDLLPKSQPIPLPNLFLNHELFPVVGAIP